MRLVLVVLALLALVACGGDEAAPAQVVGVIVSVQDGPNGEVESFELDSEEDAYTIHIAPDVDYGFALGHLHEHESTGDPVRCVLEEREDRLYALEILDAA